MKGTEKNAVALKDYLKLIDSLADMNGDDLFWWATQAASKNRVMSPVVTLLNNGIVNASFLSKCRGRFSQIKDLFVEFGRVLKKMRIAKKEFRKQNSSKSTYVIKTFLYASSVKDKTIEDPFFGPLAVCMQNECTDLNIVTVYVDFDHTCSLMRQVAAKPCRRFMPLEFFISYRDAFVALGELLVRIVAQPFDTPQGCRFMGKDVSESLGRFFSIQGAGLSYVHYVHRYAAHGLLREYNVAGSAITYEGNAWERMYTLGMREQGQRVEIVGYQHAVVPMAAAGVFPQAAESQKCPLPDRVLTTGKVPADIISSYSAMSGEQVTPVGALRYSYAQDLNVKPPLSVKDNLVVLVALEGLAEAIDLVKYVLDNAAKCDNVIFFLRAHPSRPLAVYLDELNVMLEDYSNVHESEGLNVLEDLQRSDVVLYWGTTMALEALLMGIPLVHFDRNDLLSNDPLFAFDVFKWVVNKNVELMPTFIDIKNVKEADFIEKQQEGISYVKKYFHPVNESVAQQFCPLMQGSE